MSQDFLERLRLLLLLPLKRRYIDSTLGEFMIPGHKSITEGNKESIIRSGPLRSKQQAGAVAPREYLDNSRIYSFSFNAEGTER